MIRMLSNFYLTLLIISPTDEFRIRNQYLYAAVRQALANSINEDEETIQNIFEKMVEEDR